MGVFFIEPGARLVICGNDVGAILSEIVKVPDMELEESAGLVSLNELRSISSSASAASSLNVDSLLLEEAELQLNSSGDSRAVL